MSLHRLSAGRGYQYLTRNTACGDLTRGPREPLTTYYTESGYPVGRWLGTGLTGQGSDGAMAIKHGDAVTEEQMANLFGQGQHPCNGGSRLGDANRSTGLWKNGCKPGWPAYPPP